MCTERIYLCVFNFVLTYNRDVITIIMYVLWCSSSPFSHPFLYYVRVSKEENITMTRERWVGGWWLLLALVRIILYEFIHNYIIVVGATMRVFLLSAMCRWVFELNAVLFLSPSTSSSSFITILSQNECQYIAIVSSLNMVDSANECTGDYDYPNISSSDIFIMK